MADERLRFAVAGEDEVHRALGTKLAEAIVDALAHEREAHWIVRGDTWDRASIAPHPDRPPERRFYDIHQAPRHLAGRPRRTMLHGHLDGKPLGGDGRRLRQVVLDHAHAEEPPHLLVILHDTDGREAPSGWARRSTASTATRPVASPTSSPTCVGRSPGRSATGSRRRAHPDRAPRHEEPPPTRRRGAARAGGRGRGYLPKVAFM